MIIDTSEIEACSAEIRKITEQSDIDMYSKRALMVISQRLDEIAEGVSLDAAQVYGLIARLVVEQNPTILSPELGRRLIAIEKSFCAQNA